MKPCSMPKLSCSTLASGARQLVVQEAFEMTWWASASYSSSLTPMQTVMSGSFAGALMMTLRAPASRCSGGPLALGEEPRRLDHDVDAEVAPGQRGRVALGEHLDELSVDDQATVANLDRAGERP